LHLAQALSNRGRRGRKRDFPDAERLVKRLVAQELTLSFVPNAEQRLWRTVTRKKYQVRCDRIRLQNQLESLLEEAHIKLSSLVSDLLGRFRTRSRTQSRVCPACGLQQRSRTEPVWCQKSAGASGGQHSIAILIAPRLDTAENRVVISLFGTKWLDAKTDSVFRSLLRLCVLKLGQGVLTLELSA